jgi:hypothetical protein
MAGRRWSVAVGAVLAAAGLLLAGPASPPAWAAPAWAAPGWAAPGWAAPPSTGGFGAPGRSPALPLPGEPPAPERDPFYRQPHGLDSYPPGTVLRSRPVTLPGLTALTSMRAYQLLYRTTDATGHAIATVTTLLLPTVPGPGRRKLVSYHVAEDSLTTRCAPSYTLRTRLRSAQAGEIAALLGQGWDVVVPDYEGPRSEFIVGPLEGRAALDSIRAVERFGPAGLDGRRTPVGLMGYSGGSVPTVWANALARDYAPELNLVGSAAGGIVADPGALPGFLDGTAFAGAVIAASVGIDRAYPELDLPALLNARGRALAERDARDADGCAGGLTNAPFARISQLTHYPDAAALLAVPRVERIVDKLNLITGPAPKAPSYFFNEINDEIIPIEPVDRLVAANCADGATIAYQRGKVGGHVVGGAAYSGPAMLFLRGRFAGRPAPNTCPERD